MFFMFISKRSGRPNEAPRKSGVQGTGFFHHQRLETANVLNQHTTNSGGFLVSYR